MSTHKPRLVIIADDLTGALEAGVAFLSTQTKVVVATSIDYLAQALATNADIISVSTQSREIEPQQAFMRVASVVEQIGDCAVFKKIDSRMKGNIAYELSALPEKELLVAPALPSFERFIKAGKVCGFGVAEPIDIAEKLGANVSRAQIFDITSHADFEDLLAQYDDHICVGARDLAAALAKKWGLEHKVPPAQLTGKIGIAIGSRDPITLAQVENLPKNTFTHLNAPLGHYNQQPPDDQVVLLQAIEGTTDQPADVVAQALAQSFKLIADHCDDLILSGGATAEALLNSLGIGLLDLEGELLPGIPVARAGRWRIVTKSGGFGDDSTLRKLIGCLQTE